MRRGTRAAAAMKPIRRSQPASRARTPEERERDRIERERARAARRGVPPPSPDRHLDASGAEPPDASPPPIAQPPAPAPAPPPAAREPVAQQRAVGASGPPPADEPSADFFGPRADGAPNDAASSRPGPGAFAADGDRVPIAAEGGSAVGRQPRSAAADASFVAPDPRRAALRRFGGGPPRGPGSRAQLPQPPPHSPPGGGARRAQGPRRVLAAVALVLAVALAWFLVSLFEPFKGPGHGVVVVDIPPGSGVTKIGDLLAKNGVVSSGFFFSARATLAGDRSNFKSGRYVLKHDMSYGAALDVLTKPPAAARVVKIVIPEGPPVPVVAGLVTTDGLTGSYAAATRHSHLLSARSYGAPAATNTLEGFLFPATYEVRIGAPASLLVAKQLTAFKQYFHEVNLRRARARHLTPYDVLIIASMVERETAVARQRPLIAAVIYNRLRKQMPLGIDSTIRYAVNNYTTPLTSAQLAVVSPYNTRTHRGLPPTPIGNPGLASLRAAANPAHVPYLYFVARPGTCGDVFETSYARFLRDSARYQTARAARGGNSPTTCR